MSSAEIGAATGTFFLGFVALFLLGLKSNVGGHFPVARAVAASASATAAAWAATRLAGLHPAVALAGALGLAAVVAYRPPWWAVPLVAAAGAGFHYLLALAA